MKNTITVNCLEPLESKIRKALIALDEFVEGEDGCLILSEAKRKEIFGDQCDPYQEFDRG